MTEKIASLFEVMASESVTNKLLSNWNTGPERSNFLKGFTEITGSFWLSPGGFVVKSGHFVVSFIPKGQDAILINDLFALIKTINGFDEKFIVTLWSKEGCNAAKPVK